MIPLDEARDVLGPACDGWSDLDVARLVAAAELLADLAIEAAATDPAPEWVEWPTT